MRMGGGSNIGQEVSCQSNMGRGQTHYGDRVKGVSGAELIGW